MTDPPRTPTPVHAIGCACEGGDAHHSQFELEGGGCDETDGRYADVTLQRCRSCHRLWLRYQVEYEAFPKSGRWARGLISDEAAAKLTPEGAEPYLNGLEWYLYGGSFFDGGSGRHRGPMCWS